MNLFWGNLNNEKVAEYKKAREKVKSNDLKFMLRFKRELLSKKDYKDHKEFISGCVKWCSQVEIKPSDLVISFDAVNLKKTFSKLELNNLKTLTDELKQIGVMVGVFDCADVFSYDEVKNATDIIKKNAYLVNKQNYSPLEKLIRAYLIVTNKKYKAAPMHTSREISMSRSVYGVLNSEYIVCVGYGEHLKAIIDECKDPNLAVFENSVAIPEVNKIEQLKDLLKQKDPVKLEKWLKQNSIKNMSDLICPHQTNLVYIKDDKYKIDGFYYLDPTKDSSVNTKGKNVTFLLGISQIKDIGRDVIDSRSGLKLMRELKKEMADVLKTPVSNTRIKARDNYMINHSIFNPTSVSSDRLIVSDGEISDSYFQNKDKVDTLYTFLQKRQDFRDFVTLKQTEKDLKDKGIDREFGFDEIISKNYKNSDEDIKKNDVIFDSKAMFEYLEEHSSCVDVGQVNSALNVVLKNMYKDEAKDEISKKLYDSYAFALKCEEWLFEKPNSTTDLQSEEPVK